MRRSALFAMLLGVFLMSGVAVADDFYVIGGGGGVGTKITSAPYTITDPGFYYLGGNLKSTAYCIIVDADDVTIDLMGYKISGSLLTNLPGILIKGRKNVEIRNGTITGCGHGIMTSSGGERNLKIVNIRAVGNANNGISLTGVHHIVKGCTASDNGNYGIYVGTGCLVKGNIANDNKYGIGTSSNCLVIHNIAVYNTTNNLQVSGTVIDNHGP